ncbi:MAG: NAD(P)-dependent alcohol dehydrogenase [Actinomycetia bacterium]|nr:NAD(P)-dependent alcohol dehydrogenase [Actinomycetes bacterium]
MKAIVQDRYGSADVLEFRRVSRPALESTEVLVEVHAAGVDRGTWHLMTGIPYLVRIAGFGLTRPKQPIPGLDVAGRVVAVGDEVTRFTVGDEVFGIASGSLAEYATASEDKLAPKPGSISFEQAGVAAVSGITALQALVEVGRLEVGQRVLIVGASGGVGSFAVQLAKALGAEVTGVAGPSNLDLVQSLGADHVLDHTRDDLTQGDPHDLIIDIGGRTRVARLRRALTPRGTLVIVGGEGGDRLTGGIGRQIRAVLVSPFVSQRLTMVISKEHHSFMDQLAEHISSGAVTPSIGRRFTLAQAPEALRLMDQGQSRAKSVITVRDQDAR